MVKQKKTIGILALQGAFLEHQKKINELGAETVLIRNLSDAQSRNFDGIILPGGESTTMKKLLGKTGLDSWVKKAGESGLPIFGTCAGLIILADMGLLDVKVERNAYGSQLDSFEDDIKCEIRNAKSEMIKGIFIRAPKIVSVGKSVQVFANHKDIPVLVRQKNIMAASFHPELADDTRIHEFFLEI